MQLCSTPPRMGRISPPKEKDRPRGSGLSLREEIAGRCRPGPTRCRGARFHDPIAALPQSCRILVTDNLLDILPFRGPSVSLLPSEARLKKGYGSSSLKHSFKPQPAYVIIYLVIKAH